uniref:Electron carrier/iron ion-binding protein n=1 Tax=Davidia involucrata TaxID=16924 RepID=A0A5B7AMS7_DAVIN
MAASSPALSNNSTDAAAITTTAATIATPTTNASKNLRGLNKPKCFNCGNVARSRCPYQSCKSCCAKAQNPCHIHVLKANATFTDKTPASSSALFDQQSTEISPSGSSFRVASLRQLSNNFAQFNNLQSPLRSRKPLTRKDAAVINEWRFLKLKEYKDRNIEAGNEAFDRYMQNVCLLEEMFSVNSTTEGPIKDESPISNPNPTSMEDSPEMMILGLKLKLRSNPVRTENFRKRVQEIVDQGLRKLRKLELNNVAVDLNEPDELVKRSKKPKTWQEERALALNDLTDNLNKAQNEDDLKSCMEMKSKLFNWHTKTNQVETEDIEISKQQTTKNDLSPKRQSNYSPPKWCSTTSIDQDALNRIDVHFSSLDEIEDL